jgi:hypothetical protein
VAGSKKIMELLFDDEPRRGELRKIRMVYRPYFLNMSPKGESKKGERYQSLYFLKIS